MEWCPSKNGCTPRPACRHLLNAFFPLFAVCSAVGTATLQATATNAAFTSNVLAMMGSKPVGTRSLTPCNLTLACANHGVAWHCMRGRGSCGALAPPPPSQHLALLYALRASPSLPTRCSSSLPHSPPFCWALCAASDFRLVDLQASGTRLFDVRGDGLMSVAEGGIVVSSGGATVTGTLNVGTPRAVLSLLRRHQPHPPTHPPPHAACPCA
jgi:hypothetical protein